MCYIVTKNISKFGSNPAIAITEEDIWDGGGLYKYLDNGERLKIISDNENDRLGGIGASSVHIYGCNNNYEEIDEILDLNGINSIETQFEYLRIWRAIIRKAGSSGENIGNILIKNNIEDNTLAKIMPGNNQTLMALWTVPKDAEFKLNLWYGSSATDKDMQFNLYIRPPDEVFQLKKPITIKHGFFKLETPLESFLYGGTDIAVRAFGSNPGGRVSSGFDGFYN